jgi:hypothetical protein
MTARAGVPWAIGAFAAGATAPSTDTGCIWHPASIKAPNAPTSRKETEQDNFMRPHTGKKNGAKNGAIFYGSTLTGTTRFHFSFL